MLAVMSVLGFFSLAGPAQADESGLVVEAQTIYTLESDRVAVEIDMILTNTLPDSEEGGVTFQYYFDTLTLPIPAGAVDVVARTNSGSRLQVSSGETDGNVQSAVITLGSRLLYGAQQRIRLDFDLPGAEERSDGQFRINEAYAWFVAWAYGDPGRSFVSVRIPGDYQAEWLGGPLTGVEESDGDTVFSVAGLPNPAEWYLVVSARNDAALRSEIVSFRGGSLELRSWPQDEEWLAYVTETVDKGLPAMIEAVGQPWPRSDLEILQSYTPTIYGYAGWYLPETGRIEIGESLDAQVILHEAAHLWFNESLFDARWINEGLSEEYAYQARLDSFLPGIEPRTSLGTDGRVSLNRWGVPTFQRDGVDDQEFYGYEASWFVTHELVADIGLESMAAVIAAASDDEIAYRGAGEPESVDPRDDWRRYLDLLEEVGGSTRAEGLFREYVVTRLEEESLDLRAVARDRYAAAAAIAGDWAMPLPVRRPMSDWEFEEALAAIQQVGAILEERDEVAAMAGTLGVDQPDLERMFEEAEEFGSVASAIEAQSEAITALNEARDALDDPQGIMEKIGLVGEEFADDYEQAVLAFESNDLDQALRSAREVESNREGAAGRGATRVTVSFGSATLVVGAWYLLVRRRQGASTTQTSSSPSA